MVRRIGIWRGSLQFTFSREAKELRGAAKKTLSPIPLKIPNIPLKIGIFYIFSFPNTSWRTLSMTLPKRATIWWLALFWRPALRFVFWSITHISQPMKSVSFSSPLRSRYGEYDFFLPISIYRAFIEAHGGVRIRTGCDLLESHLMVLFVWFPINSIYIQKPIQFNNNK